MTRKVLLGVLLAGLLSPANAAHAGVKVRFVDPQHYTDAGGFGAASRDATLAEIRAYLEKLGTRLLAPGQNLTIEVLNIDLAGEFEPWRRDFSDVRIMRDITPPSFKLRYVLSEKGKPVRRGEDDITDMNYQMNLSARSSIDRYAYDKALLDDWFRRVIVHHDR